MTYYKLLSPKHKDTIVRTEGRSQQQYISGKGWVDSGIMIQYFSDESDFYGNYTEISESEAMEIVNRKGSGSSS
jgi:hypothetical protein